jgi:hypothetical protein
MKECTNKEKTAGSSNRKRKLDFSKEEREEKQTIPMASKAETSIRKKKNVIKQAEFRNHETSIQGHSPHSVQKTCSTNSADKALISENKKEIKAKDLEIRKLVRDIILGGLTNPAIIHSPKISKDAMQGDTSNEEASRINCLNAAQKSGLATYSRKNRSPKQDNREMECKERNGVKGVKYPSSMKSNAEKMAAKHPSRDLKGKGTREDKTSNSEAQNSILNSKHVDKKNGKGHRKAKSPELEAKTPAKVSIIFALFYVVSLH